MLKPDNHAVETEVSSITTDSSERVFPSVDDLIRETFDVSLSRDFENSVRLAEGRVRQGIDYFHSLLDQAIHIGDNLGLFDGRHLILIESLRALAGSPSDFFEEMPSSLMQAIDKVKENGLRNFLSTIPGENKMLSLVCNTAALVPPKTNLQQTNSFADLDPRTVMEDKERALEMFLIKAQLIYNGAVDAVIYQSNHKALRLDMEVSLYHKIERKKLLDAGVSPKDKRVLNFENRIGKIEKRIEDLDHYIETLAQRRLELYKTEDPWKRAIDLALELGKLLETRVTVLVAKEFGVISDAHALQLQSLWDLRRRSYETGTLGRLLDQMDGMLSAIFPEGTTSKAERGDYERSLWELKDFRKIITKLTRDIGYKQMESFGEDFHNPALKEELLKNLKTL